jgi:hypothetical protein
VTDGVPYDGMCKAVVVVFVIPSDAELLEPPEPVQLSYVVGSAVAPVEGRFIHRDWPCEVIEGAVRLLEEEGDDGDAILPFD